jgi:hypothetical protein
MLSNPPDNKPMALAKFVDPFPNKTLQAIEAYTDNVYHRFKDEKNQPDRSSAYPSLQKELIFELFFY